MEDFEILKQEIQSWYPNYEFSNDELNTAVRDLINFFVTGVLNIYEAKSENNRLQLADKLMV